MTLDELQRIATITEEGCWLWPRSKNSSGYGQITIKKQYWTTHRLAYHLANGAIPQDTLIRHTCHTRSCCNPDHLVPGKDADNYHDSVETHLEAAKKNRGTWTISGVSYPTLREASKKTGLSHHSLCKYTVDGVFNIQAYRAACKKAGWKPKV